MSQAKAVDNIGKSQYFVQPGQIIEVDRLSEASGSLKLSEVLLVLDGDKTIVGQPIVPHATIHAEVLDHKQGKKIYVEKYKAKSRYHKIIGSRAKLTTLKISQIDIREK